MNQDWSERCKMIDRFARKDTLSRDDVYNTGLQLVVQLGYAKVCTQRSVKYHVMCNNL